MCNGSVMLARMNTHRCNKKSGSKLQGDQFSYLDVSRATSGSRLRLSSEVVKLSATQTSGVLPLDWSSLDRRVFWRCLGSICLQISCKWSFHCRHSLTYSMPERYLTPSNPSIAASTGSDASPNLQIAIVRSILAVHDTSILHTCRLMLIMILVTSAQGCYRCMSKPHTSMFWLPRFPKLRQACSKPNLYYA